jgi:hypothetical protein
MFTKCQNYKSFSYNKLNDFRELLGDPPLDTLKQGVPHRLEQIQTGIDALQNSVNAVAADVKAIIPSDQSQTRFTPPIVLSFEFALLSCTVVNVAPFRRSIHVGVVRGDGTSDPASVTVQLAPGKATHVEMVVDGPLTRWCRSTVHDGSRTDIRAAIAAVVLFDGEFGSKITLAAE